MERGDIRMMSAEGLRTLAGDKPQREAVQVMGDTIMGGVRQLGLTARAGLQGLGGAVGVLSDPFAAAMNIPYMLATGKSAPIPFARQTAKGVADQVPIPFAGTGLPTPQTPTERVAGSTAELMAGAGGLMGLGRAAAQAAPGAIQQAGQFMSQAPAVQLSSAVGSGMAGGSVKESGGGPGAEFAASLLGSVAGGMAPGVASRASDAVSRALTPRPTAQQIDIRIQQALTNQGVDWSALPANVRASLRDELARSLNTGDQINPEALRRLADFRTVGATPTRGMVTLDPVQITRERNLSKMAANSGQTDLQGLPMLENRNNRSLIDTLNNQGANTPQNAVGAGGQVIDTLTGRLASEKAGVDRLYAGARDSQGRSFPLDGTFMTNRAANMLEDGLLQSSLPADVRTRLNDIAKGKMPFTVDTAELLKTKIGDLQRASNDGSVRKALGLVRQAIDETPLVPLGGQSGPANAMARNVNPGNLPYVPGSTDVGQGAVDAFNAARQANRTMMQRIESTPALKAVYEGVEPDKFVQKFITGQGADASIKSLQAMREAIGDDASALNAVRGQIASHLKSQALNGAADEVGNFSAAGYRKALDAIGPEKLRIFFSPEEVAQLEAARRVAEYTQFQPRGSAVNNSNSGALVLGRTLDAIIGMSGRLPFGRAAIGDPLRDLQISIGTRDAANVAGGLLNPRPSAPLLTGNALLPAALSAGLLAP